MTFDPAKLDFLNRWAAENKCYVETDGQVGFGRPCVGIIHGSAYVDLPLYPMDAAEDSDERKEYYRQWTALPPSPADAYHKHDCLAVLIQGDTDRDAALEQLYEWVVALNDRGFHVRTQDRETYNKDGIGRALELVMGGMSQAVLEVPA